MRHRKKAKLAMGKDYSRRKMRQYSNALVLHERIETTAATGKLIRSHVEKLITKGKTETLHARRQLFSELSDNAARKVYEVLSPKFKDRKGGYTRLIRVPSGKDGMPKVIVEFVE